MGKKKQKEFFFPELQQIIDDLQSDRRQDLLILIIPSHDQDARELSDQDQWAGAALELLGQLYGGATAFKTFKGVYRRSDGKLLYDSPILVESYVERQDLENEGNLMELLRFIKRMGKDANQAAVGLVINSVFHEITDFTVK